MLKFYTKIRLFIRLKTKLFILITTFIFIGIISIDAKTIKFSGFEWSAKSGYEFPGKNFWREDNAFVDKNGYLHLKIQKIGNDWTTAEVVSNEQFGYGKITFEIVSNIANLDKNVVFGLFNYPKKNNAVNGAGEIDIEFAKWGKENANIGNYTVCSDNNANFKLNTKFPVSTKNDDSSHSITRTVDNVFFQSFQDFTESNLLSSWNFKHENISKIKMPIRINLWLFNGQPPSNLTDTEIIVKSVKFEKMS